MMSDERHEQLLANLALFATEAELLSEGPLPTPRLHATLKRRFDEYFWGELPLEPGEVVRDADP